MTCSSPMLVPKQSNNDPARISRRVTTLRLMHFLWHKQLVVVDSKLDTLEENLNRVKRELEIPEEKEQVRPIFSVYEALRSIGSVRRFANCWFIDTWWLLNAHFFYCSYLITSRKYFVCLFFLWFLLFYICFVWLFCSGLHVRSQSPLGTWNSVVFRKAKPNYVTNGYFLCHYLLHINDWRYWNCCCSCCWIFSVKHSLTIN